MEYGNVTLGQVEAVWNRLGGDRGVQRFLSGQLVVSKIRCETRRCFTVTIDYGTTLHQMIAAGNYNCCDDEDISTQAFLVKGVGKKEVELTIVHFNREITSTGSIKKMAKEGYRPARIEELLAFGILHPEVQRRFPIVALGSVGKARRDRFVVPCLDGDKFGRDLELSLWADRWDDYYRFAFVRK